MTPLTYPFDPAQVLRKKRSLKKELLQKPGLIDKKIALLSGSTIGEVCNILELFLLQLGIRPTFYEGEYGLFYEDAVFGGEALSAFGPDLVYVHTSNRNLRHWPGSADDESAVAQKRQAEQGRFEAVWAACLALGCPVVQNNFELPLWRSFGHLDAWAPAGRVAYVRRLNDWMADYAAAHEGFYIHDLAYLAAAQGLDAWCDASAWYAYKYCCAVDCIPTLCHSLAALIGAVFGRGKKGVVCDLDNTLWGGVVGEDGPEGIEVGDESPTGMAYAELQRYLQNLAHRGVLLAVASKNEAAAALSGFERAGSVLTKEDFVAFEAHWGPKSQSVASIAETLNVLPESLVFFDDNPAERENVRRALPQVETPPVDAPENSVALLDRAGWFEAAAVSADDLKRGDMYRQNAQRAQLEQGFEDYEAYLVSLEMRAEITPFRPGQLERVTQLINKTNQFNLTTRRYSEGEVKARMESHEYITLSGRLTDRFGDNGITSAIIGKIQDDTLEIELWVMSCRVFKRDLELAMFDALVAAALGRGVRALVGRWLPTAKNLLVKDFYGKMQFDLVAETDAERVYRRAIDAGYKPQNHVIAVEDTHE